MRRAARQIVDSKRAIEAMGRGDLEIGMHDGVADWYWRLGGAYNSGYSTALAAALAGLAAIEKETGR